jgi:hypothetical protein
MVMCTRRILTGSFPSTYSLKFGEFLWLAEQNPACQGTGAQGRFPALDSRGIDPD